MQRASKHAARGGAMVSAAQLWLTACSYFLAVVLARQLGPQLYGVFGIVYSVLMGVELIGRFGVPQALSKLIAEESGPTNQLEASGLTLSGLIYLSLFALFWVAAPSLASLFDIERGTFLFRLAAIDIPINGAFFAVSHVLTGHRRFGASSAGIAIYASTRAIGIVVLVLVGISVEAALLLNIATSIAALVFVLSRISARSLRPSRRHWKVIGRLAAPIAFFSMGSELLSRVDLWALGSLGRDLPKEIIGQYVAAVSLAKLPNLIFFVIAGVLVPVISRALADEDRELATNLVQGAMRFLAVFLLPAVVIGAIEAGPLLEFIYSSEYRDGTQVLSILLFGYGFAYTTLMSLGALLIAASRADESALLTTSLVPLCLLLNVMLIPAYGAVGAAVGTTTALAVGAIAAGVLVYRRLGALIKLSDLLKSIVAVSITAALATQISSSGMLLLVELGALFVLNLVLLFAAGVVRRADVDQFLPDNMKGSRGAT